MPETKCPSCGKTISQNNRFCDGCGCQIDTSPADAPPSSEQEAYYRRLNLEHQRREERRQARIEQGGRDWKSCQVPCLVLVAIFVGVPLIAVSCTVIFGLFDSSDPDDVPDSKINGRLTDSQYGQVADALTAQAVERNWCYKRDGSLDSRDGYILVVFAEDIAGSLFGAASHNVIREDKLTEALLDRNWSRFTGPDYDRGGTEYRYRPPGCR